MLKSCCNSKAIGSLPALAAALRVSPAVLTRLADNVKDYYDWFSIEKKSGGDRQICSPRRELKLIQKRINREIFGKVDFADYLVGGLPDRDYLRNARAHSRAQCLISLDVQDFYTNIKREHVKKIFKYFFRQPECVAEVLTKITTLNGSVPQGACTSSFIANLVFFDSEHRVANIFEQKGVRYTRLLDDISLSSDKKVFNQRLTTELVDLVRRMLSTYGMKLKDSKTRITSKSNPENLMNVTGLWLNRGSPRVYRAERFDIRTAVRRVEESFKISRSDQDYHKIFNTVSGRVAKLTHIGHFEAAAYRERLRNILPHLDAPAVIRLRQVVGSLARSAPDKRGSLEYNSRYFGAKYKINILRRTDKKAASSFDKILQGCHPTQSKEQIVYG